MNQFQKLAYQRLDQDKFGYTRFKNWLVIIFFFNDTASQMVLFNGIKIIVLPLEMYNGKLRVKESN